MGNDDLKGAYSSALIFKGENYAYWKDNMYVPLMSIDIIIWVTIFERPCILKSEVTGVFTKKLSKDLLDEEIKKISYDLKARNIFLYALSPKAY